MIVYAALLVLTLFLARYVRVCPGAGTRGRMTDRAALTILFTALFLVSALRINVGNDYGNYVEFMHRIYSNMFHEVPTEAGFNLLTYGIYHLFGFENYVAVFAVFAAVTTFLFLYTMYTASEDFALSFALFMLLGYYFMSISTVRYYLALSVAFFSMRYVLKGDWPRFVLLVLAGALFHRSLLVVLVLYPMAKIAWKKWMAVPAGIICLSFLLFPSQYLKLVVLLYPSYADTVYLEGGTSITNIVRCAGVLLLAAYVLRGGPGDREVMFYCKLNVLALLLYVFCSFLPVISRIGYYLTVSQLLLLPSLVKRIGQEKTGKLVKGGVLALSAVYCAVFLYHAGDDGIRLLPYQSFLFDEMPPILSEVGW